jgi:exodeoxyribonuclease VII large subunit
MGEMARMRGEAMRKLRQSGDYEKNKRLRPAALLRSIAVISVATSKGWQDFQNTIDESRYAGAISTTLFPALLQGDTAVDSISAALGKIASGREVFDAVCIIRGGGGETGLDCYDSYELALKVCRFPLPVITGIGHASNLTLTEQVAHRNLITPTALARHILKDFEVFEDRIASAGDALRGLKRGLLRAKNAEIAEAAGRLNSVLRERVGLEQTALRHLGRRFETAAKKAVERNKGAVTYLLPGRLTESTKALLRKEKSHVDSRLPKLKTAAVNLTNKQSVALQFSSEKVRLLDPMNALKRGYSITTLNGKPVNDANDLKKENTIETRFATGSVRSTVNDIKT